MELELVFSIGMKLFLLANDFPAAKYNITYVVSVHWRTDWVRQFCRLGEKYGRSAGWIYRGNTVDGFPFVLDNQLGARNSETMTFVDDFPGTSGKFEFAQKYVGSLLLRGWAPLPDKGERADCVLITSADRVLLADVAPAMERPDVMAAFDEPGIWTCGWNVYLDWAQPAPGTKHLIACAYQYGTTYKMSGSFLVSGPYQTTKQGAKFIEDTVPWLLGGDAAARYAAG